MNQLIKIYRMLADKNRLRILKLLEHKPMCVCELTYTLGISQPSVSRHLRKLKEAGLIDGSPNKHWHEYFISRSKNQYSRIVICSLSGWLNDDPIIVEDLKRAAHANRESLCKY
ncbi:MAG: ArsR/SmtB family transcription factor [Atribacterota bacterium]